MSSVRFPRISGPFLFVTVCALSGPLLGCSAEKASVAPPQPQASTQLPSPTPSASPSNVLFIVGDTLRGDKLHAARNGVPLMPRLSAFAKDSWDFSRCSVQATWTKPSMASIFTSLYPEVHQVLFGPHDNVAPGQPKMADAMPVEIETLATYLKARGYATHAIQTNPNLHESFGFSHGFDSYFFVPYPAFTGDKVTSKALSTLENLKPPFLFYVHYMDPHAPYQPPSEFTQGFGDAPELTQQDQALLRDYRTFYEDMVNYQVGITEKRTYPELSDSGKEYIRYQYDGEVRFLDDAVGTLVESVTARYPNTIVVFTSDHGEELWEHGSVGHGKTVYDELAIVPLIIHVPGKAMRAVEQRVETIDILPTLATLLQTESNAYWQGRDLSVSTVANEAERPAFTSTRTSVPMSKVDLAAISIGPWKLIVDRIRKAEFLYNLERDPGEVAPVLGELDHVATLRGRLDEFSAMTNAHPLRPSTSQHAPMDDATREAIEAIGYAAGAGQ